MNWLLMMLLNIYQRFLYQSNAINNFAKFHRIFKKRKYFITVLRKYAETFIDKKMYSQARAVYKKMIILFPHYRDVPMFHDQIVETHTLQNNSLLAVEERWVLARRYGPNSTWRNANKENYDSLMFAEGLSKRYLLETARDYKHLGDKTRKKVYYKKSINAYQTFIDFYMTDKDVIKHHYYIGEIYNILKNHKKAERNFLTSIRKDCISDINGLSLENLVLIYHNQISKKETGDLLSKLLRNRKYKISGPQKLPTLHSNLIKSVNNYDSLALNKEATCFHLHLAGESYYKYNHYEKSRKYLMRLLDECKSKKRQILAVKWILKGHTYQQNLSEIELWSKRYLALIGPDSMANFRGKQSAKKIMAASIFGLGKKKEDEGDLIGAINEYLRLQENHPNSKHAAKALYRAATLYLALEKALDAETVFRRIIEKYPKTEYAPKSLYELAIQLEKRFRLKGALARYISFRKRYPDHPFYTATLYNMARVLESLKQYKAAINYIKKYMEKSKKYS